MYVYQEMFSTMAVEDNDGAHQCGPVYLSVVLRLSLIIIFVSKFIFLIHNSRGEKHSLFLVHFIYLRPVVLVDYTTLEL